MIRGLDDDDCGHLQDVDSRKVQQERLQKEEELKELNDYRARVQELQEKSADEVVQTHIYYCGHEFHSLFQKIAQLAPLKPKPKDAAAKTSQRSILSSAIKRKSQTSIVEPPVKKQFAKVQQPSALKCFAILPGIGDYKSSDESGDSSGLEDVVNDKTDLTGRSIIKKKVCSE